MDLLDLVLSPIKMGPGEDLQAIVVVLAKHCMTLISRTGFELFCFCL